jgi:hypothetical protein
LLLLLLLVVVVVFKVSHYEMNTALREIQAKPLPRPASKWDEVIEVGLKETQCEHVDWNLLA